MPYGAQRVALTVTISLRSNGQPSIPVMLQFMGGGSVGAAGTASSGKRKRIKAYQIISIDSDAVLPWFCHGFDLAALAIGQCLRAAGGTFRSEATAGWCHGVQLSGDIGAAVNHGEPEKMCFTVKNSPGIA